MPGRCRRTAIAAASSSAAGTASAAGSEWITQLPDNNWVGRYDPGTNMTFDVHNNFAGWGNLLTSLLRRK